MGAKDKTRVVAYKFEGEIDDCAAEQLLANARAHGVVTQYDSGRGHFLWFNGHPGKALRAVRDAIRNLVKP